MAKVLGKQLIEELSKPMRFEFMGKEKEFEENVFENIEQIIDVLELPEIKLAQRQIRIQADGMQAIMDIVVRHVDGSATIFEVKRGNIKHPATAPFNQMQAIGQMLLYRELFEAATNVDPRLILIDNKIFKRTYMAFLRTKLPITLMELQKDRLFIPYKSF